MLVESKGRSWSSWDEGARIAWIECHFDLLITSVGASSKDGSCSHFWVIGVSWELALDEGTAESGHSQVKG